jgi:hypothetical protein
MSEEEQPSDYTLKKSKIKLVNKELSINTKHYGLVKYNTIPENYTYRINYIIGKLNEEIHKDICIITITTRVFNVNCGNASTQITTMYNTVFYNILKEKILCEIDKCMYLNKKDANTNLIDFSFETSKLCINQTTNDYELNNLIIYDSKNDLFLKVCYDVKDKIILQHYKLIDDKFIKEENEYQLDIEEQYNKRSSLEILTFGNNIIALNTRLDFTLTFLNVLDFTERIKLEKTHIYKCHSDEKINFIIKEKYVILQEGYKKIILYDFVNNDIIKTININQVLNIQSIENFIETGIFITSDGEIIRLKEDNGIPEEEQCCICFNRIRERYLMFACGHTRTCIKCLKKIEEDGSNCPLCRKGQIPLQKLFI